MVARREIVRGLQRGIVGPLVLFVIFTGGWQGLSGSHAARLVMVTPTPTAVADVCAVPAAAPRQLAAPTPDAATATAVAPSRRGIATPSATITTTAKPNEEDQLTTELTAVARALAACFTAGRAPIIATLATERYLGQLYGGGIPLDREAYLAIAPELDPVRTVVRAVRDVRRLSATRASAEVLSVVGNQLLRSRWTFVQAPRGEQTPGRSAWRVDFEEALPFEPPADAERLIVGIEEYGYTLIETKAEGPTVVLEGANGGSDDHELLVFRFAEGVTTANLLRVPGPGLPEGVTYVGQVTVPAGKTAELVLVDLEPGDYTIVCLFLATDGLPHLAKGMAATFTVT
jgi:hypothetical protein